VNFPIVRRLKGYDLKGGGEENDALEYTILSNKVRGNRKKSVTIYRLSTDPGRYDIHWKMNGKAGRETHRLFQKERV